MWTALATSIEEIGNRRQAGVWSFGPVARLLVVVLLASFTAVPYNGLVLSSNWLCKFLATITRIECVSSVSD